MTTTAQWEVTDYNPFVGMTAVCSACGHQILHSNPNPNFCSNCGAKMANANEEFPKGFLRALDSF